jgi:acyl-CoA synthetase (AMP-forming)/AMP-acid ligase II
MGMEKGDRIGIIADTCNQHVDIFWTAIKAGLVPLTPNPGLPQQELSYLINNSGAKVLIFGQNYQELVESLRPKLKSIKHYIIIGDSQRRASSYEELISAYPPLEPKVKLDEDDLVLLPCSSGTTGLPKQIMYTRRALLAWLLDGFDACEYDMRHEDIYLNAASVFWTSTFPMVTIWSFYLGCPLVIPGEIAPQSVLESIEREGVTNAFMSTALVSELTEYSDLGKHNYSSLRHIIVSGAPLPTEVWRRAIDAFGNIFTIDYGSVEAGNLCFLYPRDFIFEGSPGKVKRLRSCGKEATNVEVRVVDEQGNNVEPGQIGEVIARGAAMMKGYWKQPKATRETIKGNYFYTGDLATIDEEGYIYLSSRKKDVITSQGKTVVASEIEDIIYRNPQVLETAVIGIPHRELGETIKAIVVLRKGAEAKEDEIIELCQQYLPPYAVPESVDFVDRLPRNPSGKILKYALREKYTRP